MKLEEQIVSLNSSVKEALQKIDKSSNQTIFVVDENLNVVAGYLPSNYTDGDYLKIGDNLEKFSKNINYISHDLMKIDFDSFEGTINYNIGVNTKKWYKIHCRL